MATKVTATLIDDLDGQPAGETLGVGLDGTVYEIDLSAANAKAFRAGFGPYVENGRKVTGKPAGLRRRLRRGAECARALEARPRLPGTAGSGDRALHAKSSPPSTTSEGDHDQNS
jgi:hypothetical protein